MASPFSGLVLGSGALLASPALWAAFVDGTMSMQTALVRFAVAVLVTWVGLSLLAFLVSGTTQAVDDAPLAVTEGPVRGAVVDVAQEAAADQRDR